MTRTAIAALTALLALAMIPASAQYPAKLRVPLVQDDTSDPDAAANLKAIRARGIAPHDIHRAYANAPKLQRRSSALAQAIRNDATVSRADRELIILRAAQNMRGAYQYRQHVPMAVSCGVTRAQIGALPRWRESKLFSERQRAILAYADGMVSEAGVSDADFEAMKGHFSTREIVELTMMAAYYSGSAQITRALGVQPEKEADPTGYGRCR
jgi:alkylhydroperoxidase family enzyme